jgi:hypothetical protein
MPGDTQEVIDARVGGLGTTLKYYSVEWLKENVRQIRSEFPYFDRVRRQPVAPVVKAVSSNRQIVLDWGNDPETVSRIEQDIPGVSYCFEGYRVWQLPSATAPGDSGMCIATFDKTSPPSVIIGKKYDPDHGLLIEVPLIKGTNSGIAHYITIEWDHLNDQSFIDGKDYFFGVTAYDYSDKPGNSYPVSESALSRITVTAEYSNPGYTAQSGDMLEVIHSGLSTGEVQALVVNPANVTGHTYEVVFDDQQNWSVIDMQTEEVKISDQTNLSGDGRYPVIDGILTIVTGPDSSDLKGWEYNGDRWITSVDWGGRFFYGGLDTGARFMGSTLTSDELVPVQLVFQDWTDVHAHGYTSRGAVYRRDLDYAYAGTGNLPITAYDVSDPEKPRRINICFVEDDNASAENGTKANLVWDMGWNSDSGQFAPMGGREYLYIMKSDYNEGADYDGNNIGTMSDVLFAIWPAARGLRIYLQSEFTIDLIIDRMNTPDDVFTFTAPPAPSVPNRFRVYQNYPNPFNQNTTFRFWIPQHTQVNLSVYDILGRRVATLVDAVMDRGEYFQHWETPDLASGLYIYRLQAGNQEKRGKMVLVK